MTTIGATTLGEILPSSMGPTTLDAVADIVAPKKPAKAATKAPKKPTKAAAKAPKKPAKAAAKTNTGRKNPDGLTIWKGPRGGLFVMKKGKKVSV